MLNKKKKVFILDGTFHIYRSYYAFLNNKNIYKNCEAIYGTFFIIKKILLNFNPEYIVITLDSPGTNFRKILSNKYKSNRKKCPIDLIYQINIIKKIIVDELGINIISFPGIEADDIIGTLSKQCERNNFNVLISSLDKDMYQLISNSIKILDIYNNKIIDSDIVYNKYGIYPNMMIDYLSLVGDVSDNIKGILGIGPKTAKILLKNIGNINFIYRNINNLYKYSNIKNINSIIKKLKDYESDVLLAYELIKINTNIFIGCKIEKLKINKYNILEINKIIKKTLNY
ncbi:DNA polymerase I [endosymbiont of Sipalinus gigas]|uniref:5'-3' exonuclease n=1 Tax=endosymbiont of Sipalinus gigas TaxID=1972134 RepID=UPI000DC71BB8|nr:5'-3' exonuclease H3TH domain-containing protein [endosymbiont of Sipalinus gigas]BBA85190.1 DNA polymerase I [endosymbiont of Sipalinus gigas]